MLFESLSIDIVNGDVVQVLGENGAGKTTLLKILAGLTHYYTGNIRYNEANLRCVEYFSSMIYLGHESGISPLLTPMENLKWFMGLHGTKSLKAPALSTSAAKAEVLREAQLLEALENADLGGYEHSLCNTLSAGLKRRVALARLYLTQASVWILDEPFTAIDRAGVEKLEQKIQAHAERGGIVVFTSHQTVSLDGIRLLNLNDFCADAQTWTKQSAQLTGLSTESTYE